MDGSTKRSAEQYVTASVEQRVCKACGGGTHLYSAYCSREILGGRMWGLGNLTIDSGMDVWIDGCCRSTCRLPESVKGSGGDQALG